MSFFYDCFWESTSIGAELKTQERKCANTQIHKSMQNTNTQNLKT